VIAEREQGRDVAVRAQPHVATTTTVAAVGTTAWHVRFAAERDAARTAVATFQVALRYVDEAGHRNRIRTVPDPASGTPYDLCVRLRQLLTALTILLAVVVVSACSSNDDSDRPAPSTTTSRSTTTTAPVSTTSGPTTVPPSSSTPTTSTVSGLTGPRIDSLTGPRSPVECNAPTSVELHWMTRNATSVTLRINGGDVFATYSNGAHDELVPLECDGTTQTYAFTAHGADSQSMTKTLKLDVTMPR